MPNKTRPIKFFDVCILFETLQRESIRFKCRQFFQRQTLTQRVRRGRSLPSNLVISQSQLPFISAPEVRSIIWNGNEIPIGSKRDGRRKKQSPLYRKFGLHILLINSRPLRESRESIEGAYFLYMYNNLKINKKRKFRQRTMSLRVDARVLPISSFNKKKGMLWQRRFEVQFRQREGSLKVRTSS